MHEPTPNMRCTGLFIPIEILDCPDLTLLEKMLLALIDGYYSEEHGGCYASNGHLANKLAVQENTIVKALIKFRKLGMIEDVSFNGRIRVIRSLMGEFITKNQKKFPTKKTKSSPKSESHSACESQADCDLNHRQTVTKITGRVGQKSHPIYRDKKAYIKDPLSLRPSPKKKSPVREKERKEEGRGFFSCLEGIAISDKDKARLCKEYPETLVSQAVKFSQTTQGKPRTTLDRALFYYCANPSVMNITETPVEEKSINTKQLKENRKWCENILCKAQKENPDCRVACGDVGVWFKFTNGPREYSDLVLYSDPKFKSLIEHHLRKINKR